MAPPSLLSLRPIPLEDEEDDESCGGSVVILPKHLIKDRNEISDRLAILRIQEETTYHVKDYIGELATYRKRASKPIDVDCRIKMCEWCYQVVDFCKFRRETVAIGMSYLDRYLCTPQGRTALCHRKVYQLAAMTCLYIAIKLHEPLEMETSLLADLSRGCYTEMEFVEMETQMLTAIHWRVNGPTCLSFGSHFWALLPSAVPSKVADVLLDYTRYQLELAVADQSLVFVPPSRLALAAILNAAEGLDAALFPPKTRSKFLRYLERYSEIDIYDKIVEKTQAELSMVMAAQLQADWDEIVQRGGPVLPTQEDGGDIGDKHVSPVSVMNTALRTSV